MSNKKVFGLQEGALFRQWTDIMVLVQYAFQIYTLRQPGIKMQIK